MDPHFLVFMKFAGADRLKARNSTGLKKESSGPKDVPDGHIAAQTFTFRELAVATKNFQPESFIGEGGFGRVYKGRLESTGQVNTSIVVLSTLSITIVMKHCFQ